MSADPFGVASEEILRPSKFQALVGDRNNSQIPGLDLDLELDGVEGPNIRSRPYQQILESSDSGEGYFKFKVYAGAHDIHRVHIRQELPLVRVKENLKKEYRIAWCRNIGHNIIIEGNIYKDGRAIQAPITSYSLDLHLQFFVPTEKRKDYRRKIGMVPELTEWTTELKPYTLHIPQPFGYSRDATKSLKKIIISEELVHIYRLRNNVSHLLRLQRFNEVIKEWEDIMGPNKVMEVCEFPLLRPDKCLDPPKLLGSYKHMTEHEQLFWKNQIKQQDYNVVFDEMVGIIRNSQSGNEITYDCKGNYHVKAMFWAASNKQAERYNNYSNYSDNFKDVASGKDPIEKSSFIRDHLSEWADSPSDNHNLGLDEELGIYYPDEPGYHAQIWCQNLQKAGLDDFLDFSSKISNLVINLYPELNVGDYGIKVHLLNLKIYQYSLGDLKVFECNEYAKKLEGTSQSVSSTVTALRN
jgi:hypothetical protein